MKRRGGIILPYEKKEQLFLLVKPGKGGREEGPQFFDMKKGKVNAAGTGERGSSSGRHGE